MRFIFSAVFLALPLLIFSQLKGHVYDENNELLAFASVYVEGTTQGTSTNDHGAYQLKLSPGEYSIVFQYVGYKVVKKKVVVGTTSTVEVDATLIPMQYILKEAVVTANSEDPAYAVIREAMRKRTYHRDLIKSFSCKSYVKGMYRFEDAPEKIMGIEIGDMGGILDSTRQGIFYLSESISEFYYDHPKQKEVMISSKFSGDDQAFSFNRAGIKDLNFYNNTIEIERQMVSPIAGNAFQYYKYRLDGIFYDEDGHLINKIEVIPKNKVKPVFEGFIYIIEDVWNIHSLDLITTSDALKLPALDTLKIKQLYVALDDADSFVLLSQNINLSFNVFGFKGGGGFSGVFSDYDIHPEFEDGFFGADVFVAQDSSNQRTEGYWSDVRPMPLTHEERSDYVKKDSLQVIWNSKTFKDSLDRIGNKFKPTDLLFGYSYHKSFERFSFEFSSPLSTLHFNPVQGYNFDLDFLILKYQDDYYLNYWSINPKIQYGFSDRRLYGGLGFKKKFNALNFARLEIDVGDEVFQFNGQNPISKTINTLYNLFGKDNYIRLYQRRYVQLMHSRELFRGVTPSLTLAYSDRSPLSNTTEHSWFNKDDQYAENRPQILSDSDEVIPLMKHQAFAYDLNVGIRIGQKYSRFPDRKWRQPIKWPEIRVRLSGGLDVLGSDVSFHKISLSLTDRLNLGTIGTSRWSVKTGTFIESDQLSIVDYFHFNGNQTLIYSPSQLLTGFFNLPYYINSTVDNYAAFHFHHNFNGFITDRIPLFKKLGWTMSSGINVLRISGQDPFVEWNVGLNNLGFGVFRLFRLDGVWSKNQDNKFDFSMRLGISLD